MPPSASSRARALPALWSLTALAWIAVLALVLVQGLVLAHNLSLRLILQPVAAKVVARGGLVDARDHQADAASLMVRYVIDGQRYLCGAGAPACWGGDGWADAARATSQLVSSHPPGSTLTAWYDPRHPATGYLSRAFPDAFWGGWLVVEASLALALLSTALACRASRDALAAAAPERVAGFAAAALALLMAATASVGIGSPAGAGPCPGAAAALLISAGSWLAALPLGHACQHCWTRPWSGGSWKPAMALFAASRARHRLLRRPRPATGGRA